MTLPATARLIATTLLAVMFAGQAAAAKLTDLEHTRIDEPRPAGVPSDAELEAAGATIGKIEIETKDIFDQTDPRENSGLFRLANDLHIRSKTASIRAQLLFASGERYTARRLAETERNLRLLPYIYDARVVPVRFADGKVDIRVVTKDVWTLSPGISFGRSGGSNSSSFNIQDTNFLGWGKTIQFVHSRTVDRTSDGVAWADPNVFGSRWTSALAYINSSDGEQRSLQITRPFYSLDTEGGANILASTYSRTVARYNRGSIVDQFDDDERSYELSGGVSRGLQDGWTTRWLFGMRYDRNLFVPTPNSLTPASPLPPDRTLSYPFVGFDLLRDNYRKAADLNQIGRTEDLYFGPEISGEVGFTNGAFGADRDALIVAAKARGGLEFGTTQDLFLTGSFSSRLEQGRPRNLIVTGVASYYWRWRPDWLLYSTLAATSTDSLDPDMQLLIGGDNGLRGYPLRYESGTSRALWSVEQRFYTDWYPFRLVRVGGAIFGDIGRTWGHGVVGNSDPGLLKDVGFGLRLGNTRSGLGNVLHIDLAFPLAHLEGINNVQFLVQAQQSF
jgi:hemolysin activation/secretion protein